MIYYKVRRQIFVNDHKNVQVVSGSGRIRNFLNLDLEEIITDPQHCMQKVTAEKKEGRREVDEDREDSTCSLKAFRKIFIFT